MSRAQLKLSLALWRRRHAWRQKRLDAAHKANDKARIAKWQKLLEQAGERVKLRQSQLHALAARPVPAKGVDVSNNNGRVDYRKVKAAGYAFVYVKAGEGTWLDPFFATNVRNARKIGLKVGGYQYLRPKSGRSGADEARIFLARLKDAKLGAGDLRPVLDCEQTNLGREGTREYIHAFVNELRAHGHQPVIYTGKWWWDPNVGDETFGCPLWIAAYGVNSPKLPDAWRSWLIWQYTDDARIPGQAGGVDADTTLDLRKVIA